MGEDESEEEESTDSEEAEQPALESAGSEQDLAGTATVVNKRERASRVVNDASSSTNHQIVKGAGGGKDLSKKETDLTKKDLDNAEDSESEEASEEDGDEVNLWGAILGPK